MHGAGSFSFDRTGSTPRPLSVYPHVELAANSDRRIAADPAI
jgi:hypothetical protein